MRRRTLSALLVAPVAAATFAGASFGPAALAAVTADSDSTTFRAPNGGVDTSTVYIVSSQAEFQDHFAPSSTKIKASKDAAGSAVVLSRTTADKVADFHQRHEHDDAGKRCPGFRSFKSQAEAESFMANDLTRQTISAALALPAIDNQATVNSWMPKVQEPRIRQMITDLSTKWPNRYYASTHGRSASTFVKDTWSGIAAGRSDVTVAYDTSCSDCGVQQNVMMTVKGSELPNEIVVIGGHIDSISRTGSGDSMNAPGADDNASGTSTVTEIARVALQSGWKPKRTVVFAGYAAEEVGLNGSDAMARSFKNQGKNVVGVLQLDMTNYDGGNYDMSLVQDYTNASLNTFSKNVFDTYLKPQGLTLGSMSCGYACSDHASWTSAGYPSSMMAEDELFQQLHTPNDTLANVGGTANHAVKYAKFGLAFLGEMAKTSSTGGPTPTPTPTATSTPTTSPSPTATPTNPTPVPSGLVNGDFEQGPSAGWTGDTHTINTSTYSAASGQYKAWLNGYGESNTEQIAQGFTVPSNGKLSFKLRVDSSETTAYTAYDKLNVQLLSSSGTVLKTLATYSNLNETSTYQAKSFDLSSYAGQSVQIRFTGTEDSYSQTSFLIDDVAVS